MESVGRDGSHFGRQVGGAILAHNTVKRKQNMLTEGRLALFIWVLRTLTRSSEAIDR
jgi:hypothetical protein